MAASLAASEACYYVSNSGRGHTRPVASERSVVNFCFYEYFSFWQQITNTLGPPSSKQRNWKWKKISLSLIGTHFFQISWRPSIKTFKYQVFKRTDLHRVYQRYLENALLSSIQKRGPPQHFFSCPRKNVLSFPCPWARDRWNTILVDDKIFRTKYTFMAVLSGIILI